MSVTVTIHTDGACSGNPGPGGWGAVLQAHDEHGQLIREREMFGGESASTNNRMELMAAIEALESLHRPARVRLVTDSIYVRNGITQWLSVWQRNGWRTAARKPVKNADLWQRLDEARQRHEVEWEWIKGHAGHPENDRADALARRGMEPFQKSRQPTGAR